MLSPQYSKHIELLPGDSLLLKKSGHPVDQEAVGVNQVYQSFMMIIDKLLLTDFFL